jgi:hypothetical protein
MMHWNTIVGSGANTPETAAQAKMMYEALLKVRTALNVSSSVSNALHTYLELSWLALAHQEQASRPNETQAEQAMRINNSVSQRQAIQRITAELFTELNPAGMLTSAAQETTRKNQH